MTATAPGALVVTPVAADLVQVITTGPQQAVAEAGVLAGLAVKSRGTFTLNGTTPVAVADTNVTTTSVIVYSFKTLGGTLGAFPTISSITAGTGFSVEGTAADTSTYNYAIL